MSKKDERRKAFAKLRDGVRQQISASGISVDIEVLESINFARTYSQLVVGINSVEPGLDLIDSSNRDLWVGLMARRDEASERIRDIEADWLGVDLSAVQ